MIIFLGDGKFFETNDMSEPPRNGGKLDDKFCEGSFLFGDKKLVAVVKQSKKWGVQKYLCSDLTSSDSFVDGGVSKFELFMMLSNKKSFRIQMQYN